MNLNGRGHLTFIYKAMLALLFIVSSPCFSIEVLTHSSNPARKISSEQLSSIFLGRMRNWPSGKKITVVIYSHFNTNHRQFCRNVLGLSPRYVRQSWDQLTYSGSSSGPVIVNTEEEMLNTIINTPSAIGYSIKKYEGVNANAIKID